MTELKVGDKVRYAKAKCYPEMQGWEAEVVQLKGTMTKVRTTQNPGGHDRGVGQTGQYMTANLELIEQPFTFADIQVGDKIRRTYTRETGTTEVREGVVTKMSKSGELALDDDVPTSASYILAYATDAHKETVVLELLERPKEPELWEDRKPGDKIATYLSDGMLDRIFTKQEDGLWGTLVISSGGKLGKGFPRADQAIAAYLTKQTVTAHIVK